jgi:hypothetical protein
MNLSALSLSSSRFAEMQETKRPDRRSMISSSNSFEKLMEEDFARNSTVV